MYELIENLIAESKFAEIETTDGSGIVEIIGFEDDEITINCLTFETNNHLNLKGNILCFDVERIIDIKEADYESVLWTMVA